MDVLVCLKRVPLAGGKLILTPDAKDIETKHLGFGISPHEENAVEAGVQKGQISFLASDLESLSGSSVNNLVWVLGSGDEGDEGSVFHIFWFN